MKTLTVRVKTREHHSLVRFLIPHKIQGDLGCKEIFLPTFVPIMVDLLERDLGIP